MYYTHIYAELGWGRKSQGAIMKVRCESISAAVEKTSWAEYNQWSDGLDWNGMEWNGLDSKCLELHCSFACWLIQLTLCNLQLVATTKLLRTGQRSKVTAYLQGRIPQLEHDFSYFRSCCETYTCCRRAPYLLRSLNLKSYFMYVTFDLSLVVDIQTHQIQLPQSKLQNNHNHFLEAEVSFHTL